MAVQATDYFIETQLLNHQKHYVSFNFPSILSPNPKPSPSSSLSDFTYQITSQKPFLDSLLLKSGAVLFRGFPVKTAKDFNDVVEAFGFEEMPYVGGAAPRTNVVGRVFTANESPPDQKIPFHHEMAQVPEFPSKLFFFCEVEPGTGGETPIVLSHIVYEKMKEKYPEFVARLEEHGLIYTRVLGEDDDPSSPIGRGWKSTFLTSDKAVAEERAAKLGMKLEWMGDGVKTIMGPIPAIKYDRSRQRKIWFNSMVAAYTGWEDARNDPVKAVTFGDGQPLPADIIYDCLKILEDECVAIPWKKGDVLLIDNWAVLHSRRPFYPPRRVLASLCK
ncbi:Clavaminate synthase-like protein [Hibiscus syriacus]|uniref:Clavaminate synthase-like protein n=1 Tax=Hibiscus syriacus TaxID=106335 RepID=A0A6A2ZD19_HIBSY|nr:clavaminate synthase-like protein At3g21360 [Hibiscus syriacus]KAE8689904.1 Clavaminate synthase-like protein [Hibiscus syriacus]